MAALRSIAELAAAIPAVSEGENTPILWLPDDMLEAIIDLLISMTSIDHVYRRHPLYRVCRKFNQLVRSPRRMAVVREWRWMQYTRGHLEPRRYADHHRVMYTGFNTFVDRGTDLVDYSEDGTKLRWTPPHHAPVEVDIACGTTFCVTDNAVVHLSPENQILKRFWGNGEVMAASPPITRSWFLAGFDVMYEHTDGSIFYVCNVFVIRWVPGLAMCHAIHLAPDVDFQHLLSLSDARLQIGSDRHWLAIDAGGVNFTL